MSFFLSYIALMLSRWQTLNWSFDINFNCVRHFLPANNYFLCQQLKFNFNIHTYKRFTKIYPLFKFLSQIFVISQSKTYLIVTLFSYRVLSFFIISFSLRFWKIYWSLIFSSLETHRSGFKCNSFIYELPGKEINPYL